MEDLRKLLTLQLCFLSTLHLAAGAYLRCYNKSINVYNQVPLSAPEPILNLNYFDTNLNTIIYIFGFMETANSTSVVGVLTPYIERGEDNVCLCNWEKEASIKTPLKALDYATYVYAVGNVVTVGNKLGDAIGKLGDAGLNVTSVHIIGFSLGAQLAGYAGRRAKNNGHTVGEITGCDPARPLYDNITDLLPLFSNLASGDAIFVSVVHTNPGFLGTYESLADVDIWANCEGLQPGCQDNNILTIASQNSCGHARSWMYYIETLTRPTAFSASNAASCSAWKNGQGTLDTVYLGELIDKQARGNYYLRTNSQSPYGLGEEGSQPD